MSVSIEPSAWTTRGRVVSTIAVDDVVCVVVAVVAVVVFTADEAVVPTVVVDVVVWLSVVCWSLAWALIC